MARTNFGMKFPDFDLLAPIFSYHAQGFSLFGRLHQEFADQTAANQPGERFDEKIPREMIPFRPWPSPHGIVAN